MNGSKQPSPLESITYYDTVWRLSDVDVSLTFRWRTHRRCLVSVATVAGDERPALAFTDGVLVPAATQALVVEEAGAGAELRLLQCRADVTVRNKSESE